jgi:hypothetical protein
MEKVKLPKEVAEAIERLRNEGASVHEIVYDYASGNVLYSQYNKLADFASDNFDTLLKALVNGYEVEMTPEEKVREYYDRWKFQADADLCIEERVIAERSMNVIKCTLDNLGIKIEGVNA